MNLDKAIQKVSQSLRIHEGTLENMINHDLSNISTYPDDETNLIYNAILHYDTEQFDAIVHKWQYLSAKKELILLKTKLIAIFSWITIGVEKENERMKKESDVIEQKIQKFERLVSECFE